ncbi:MAG: RimK family alpha-L-glutamate ligase [Clostridia bacterium]|nr:RimK family alpha-L-glutamate ligase [Clostridia bacterium]
MKGLIIRNAYYDAEQLNYQISSIARELKNLGVEVDVMKNGYDVYVGENSELVSKLKQYDFCVYLDKDKYLGLMIEKLGIPIFNSPSSIEICDDKMLTYLALLGSNVKVPKTISAPLCFTKGATVSADSVDEIIDALSLPLIAKKSFSSLGKGVFLINTKQELIDFINQNPFEPKIYQQFILSSYGRDVRIICIGKKFYSAMERYSETDFRSNSALGGNARKIIPPKQFIEVAEKVANVLNLDYMGIDLLYGDGGEPVVCEVNSNAFFSAMDKVAEVNVAKEYAKYIIKAVNKQ